MNQMMIITEETAVTVRESVPIALVYLAGLSRNTTRPTMRQALEDIAALLGYQTIRYERDAEDKIKTDEGGQPVARLDKDGQPIPVGDIESVRWELLRYEHTAAIQAELSGKQSAATVNKKMSALRGVLKTAWRMGLMSSDDYMRAIDVKPPKNGALPVGRHIPMKELGALFDNCAQDASAAGPRDAAIFAVLRVGLRESEVVGLDYSDFNQQGNDKLGPYIRVRHGKGDKERIVPLTAGSIQALDDWLKLRGNAEGALFTAVSQKGFIDPNNTRLTRQTIFHVVKRRAERAGIKESISPHDFRRTFVSDLYDADTPESTICALTGHANGDTAKKYDRRGLEKLQKGIMRINTPYVARRQMTMEGRITTNE